MTKLPDNDKLMRYYREGISDKQIAETYDVTVQAVNNRYKKMGIEKKPWSNTATAIVDAAWPAAELGRSRFTHLNRARELYSFIRWRLGDDTLTERQLSRVRHFAQYSQENEVVLTLDPESETPWIWVPRTADDGRLVMRWPEGRELPVGPHLEAISLPPAAEWQKLPTGKPELPTGK